MMSLGGQVRRAADSKQQGTSKARLGEWADVLGR
jgi:hypothetical protein